MRIAMVAGGSGGHIYPALSLAKELVSRGHSVAFIGADNRIEKDIIPENHFEFIGLAVRTTKGGPLQKVISLFSMFTSYREAKKILKGRFDLVIGFGNYISVPVVLAAKSLGIRIMLHEQNSFVGRANRF
ncbi:MAG: glycosyltransferase, partial [Erysipelotrichaceae bacterium]|nr:glycosyltransferase [Erysipelotrichaceae bacterium]